MYVLNARSVSVEHLKHTWFCGLEIAFSNSKPVTFKALRKLVLLTKTKK